MKPEFIFYPNKILTTKAKPVTKFNSALKSLLRYMKKEMKDKNGIGIAAPQVGVSLRCFYARFENKIFTFVNPKITYFSDEIGLYEEGCLSIPEIFADVHRPVAITVEAQNEKGVSFSREVDGMLARVIQHEYDHLEGILFIDRIPKPARRLALQKYRQLQKH